MRWIGTTLSAALLVASITACSGGSGTAAATDHMDGARLPTSNPTAGASGDVGLPAHNRAVGIYVAILKAQRALEPQLWRHATAQLPHHEVPPASYQAAISTQLAPQTVLRWATHPRLQPGGLVVTLPVVPPRRDHFTVRVSDFCGSTCGHFARFHVGYGHGRWVASQFGPLGVA